MGHVAELDREVENLLYQIYKLNEQYQERMVDLRNLELLISDTRKGVYCE
jgi:hypothetical protein